MGNANPAIRPLASTHVNSAKGSIFARINAYNAANLLILGCVKSVEDIISQMVSALPVR
jgi:hypothetical protein